MLKLVENQAKVESNIEHLVISVDEHKEDFKGFEVSTSKRISDVETFVAETVTIRKFKSRVVKLSLTILGTPIGVWLMIKLGIPTEDVKTIITKGS